MPKPRKKRIAKPAGILFLLAVIGVLSPAVLSWLAGAGLVTWDVAFMAQALMVFWLVLLVFSAGLIVTDVTYAASHHREQQPYEPPDDEVARVLMHESSEIFIYGKPDQTLRDALEHDWPLDKSLRDRNWHVMDSRGNDVTDRTFLEFDGIVQFVLD